MGFRDLSCDLAGGLLYTKWPLDVRSLGHRDAIARDSVSCTLCCMIEPALDPDWVIGLEIVYVSVMR